MRGTDPFQGVFGARGIQPRGLKPTFIERTIRGPKGPLFHSSANFLHCARLRKTRSLSTTLGGGVRSLQFAERATRGKVKVVTLAAGVGRIGKERRMTR